MIKKLILFFLFLLIPIFCKGAVVINEVAWMGTKASSNDEWIELYNYGDAKISLEGWTIKAKDGAPQIILQGYIYPHSLYLIERTSSTTVSDIDGDFAGSFGKNGNISNNGEDLELIDENGVVVDRVYFSSGWPYGSASPDYKSMERIDPQKDGSDAQNWQSNDGLKINGKDASNFPIFGTPKQENSVYFKKNAGESNQTQQNAEEIKNDSLNQNKELTISYNSSYYNSFNKNTIKAVAGGNRIAVAGANIDFKGEAIGLKNEPLTENVRFVWSFGDGSFKEGKNISHIYFFPGEYITVLDVASGEYAASDRVLVKVVQNKIKISEISPFNSWIELHNGSDETIDVSFWILESESKKFIFSNNTFIKPRAFLVISSQASFLNLNKSGGEVQFLYPNGFLADSFLYKGTSANGESFSVIDEVVKKSVETPGEENKPVQDGAVTVSGHNNKKEIITTSLKAESTVLATKEQKNYKKNTVQFDGERSSQENKGNNRFDENTEFKQNNDIKKDNLTPQQKESLALVSSSFKFSRTTWFIIIFGISVITIIVLFMLRRF